MGARPKAGVDGHLFAGIAVSNPDGGIDICLLWVVWVVSERSLQRSYPSSRESPSVCVIKCNYVQQNCLSLQ
jgi:hypothetical protein